MNNISEQYSKISGRSKIYVYWSAKFILRLLECKIYFASIGVQNLFCGYWSAKFILRLLECKKNLERKEQRGKIN
ncbi:MAG: hypothetical protein DRR00_17620 [Candidatus Parabeggiatoa sp. nov. 3]|nr:MAG: hypothetical protein DRR00_17620 [Gammaproteobacteria bacterium]RKZ58579.1 MAG: hypothetical protein DRQ99_25205 [Gammaproteobacteria bacterium]